MNTHPAPADFIPFSEARRALNLSPSGFSHLARRHKVKKYYGRGPETDGDGGLRYSKNDIKYFHAKRKNLPLMEDQPPGVLKTSADLRAAAGFLKVGPARVKTLIKSGRIKAYCNTLGQIFIDTRSIQEYLKEKSLHYANRPQNTRRKSGTDGENGPSPI
jgi:hypothetical protein